MPPQYSSISSFTVMPAGARWTPGFITRPEDRERAQALAAVAPLPGEPVGAAFDQVAHPEKRLHVVLEGGAAEDAHLRDVRRAQARHPALALDRLDHRGLLAANVGACASAKVDARESVGGGRACSAAISRSRIARHP